MDSSPEEVTTPPSPREDEDDEDEEDDEEEEEEEDQDTSSPSNAGTVIRAKPTLESLAHLRDLSKDAISWSLSSAKPGNGVEQIVHDVSTETYWQSDGGQPHYIRISFGRRVSVSYVALYLDYNLDESYTPKTVQVKAGMTIQDLRDVTGTMELQEPVGWCVLPLTAPPDPLDAICCLARDEIIMKKKKKLLLLCERTWWKFPYWECTKMDEILTSDVSNCLDRHAPDSTMRHEWYDTMTIKQVWYCWTRLWNLQQLE